MNYNNTSIRHRLERPPGSNNKASFCQQMFQFEDVHACLHYNAAGDDIVGAGTAVSTTVYKVGDTFTTNNIQRRGQRNYLLFAAALTRTIKHD